MITCLSTWPFFDVAPNVDAYVNYLTPSSNQLLKFGQIDSIEKYKDQIDSNKKSRGQNDL